MLISFLGGTAGLGAFCAAALHRGGRSRKLWKLGIAGVVKWDPVLGDQTMQLYGNFEGFPL